MEYNFSNLSWKRMRAKRKQEDYQSKLARDMHNFYHSGGNGFNAYGGNNHGNGNFTSKRHNRVGNFSPVPEIRLIAREKRDFPPRNQVLSNFDPSMIQDNPRVLK
ncbi:hypothetical protein M9H77_06954 [Catharanthus roseus]|uniref:Uncharacterized protein n=1 Tax=Catharanthus roseus TaxID=4058 RepID=A0ACC0BTT1_CATRO|nr:hypothetical protein M9H77_06954 [Catharanthus roseus]